MIQVNGGSISNEDSDAESDEEAPPLRMKGKHVDYQPIWCKKDLKEIDGKTRFPWSIPPPVLDSHLSPASLFELIFTPELMEHICKESNGYAVEKGPQNFDLDIPTLKLFLAILLLSGYVPLVRCTGRHKGMFTI